jgi:hypothetical protein
MTNKPKGHRGGIKNQPGKGNARKSGPPRKRKFPKKAARKRKQTEQEARKEWEELDTISPEAQKLLGPKAKPKFPRPMYDN